MALTHRIKPGSKVSLDDIDPDDTGPYRGKDDPKAQQQLAEDVERLKALQERLYAEGKQALLVILQAMDAGGKDGTLRHVVGPLDSRSVHVVAFKAPSDEERGHDFLWRVHAHAPRKGEITVFNRSHYEDVLVVRVMKLAPKELWSKRYDHINAFERLLADEGTRVVKFFLHISKGEQKKRLEERLADPEKRWKFDPGDLPVREKWGEFRKAYEGALSKCSTDWAPWHVVPANNKWYRNLAVARTLVETLEDMAPKYPKPAFDYRSIVIP
jgi:PPK2 family polyphosphate:nucleotide phosphotransferase